jgi:hypothetical protein
MSIKTMKMSIRSPETMLLKVVYNENSDPDHPEIYRVDFLDPGIDEQIEEMVRCNMVYNDQHANCPECLCETKNCNCSNPNN